MYRIGYRSLVALYPIRYTYPMSTANDPPKPLVILADEIKSPPFAEAGRIEAGRRLREVQLGALLPFPIDRPMPSIGPGVHELRIRDAGHNWRLFYRIDADAIVLAMVHPKRTQETPKHVIDECKRRLRRYDAT
jgi:phage-related protein